MGSHCNFIYTICFVITFSVKARVLAAPTETEDCSVPIHLKNTDCCTSSSSVSLTNPVVNQECVKILSEAKASSYEEFESAVECFLECLFKTIHLLNGENKVIYEEILTNITQELKPDFANLEINKIKHCVEEDYTRKKSSQCKSGSLQFFLCVLREKILNCPPEVWKNSDECNKYKSVLENCPKRTPLFQIFDLEPDVKSNKTE
ncbi:uncharacterized protein [Halyomorpha halys]|uniref:uncharacterized protein isoform X1 n=1 Tax=Halyomorpha halys TaxID=286706 RepID=UPI0006D4F936|nr:uncharacterized protein LOC106679782 isoform X2 [Halyomorpha halys]KAE8573676.1 Odorant-binding protein 9 [Halyomorpha halys]